MSQRISWIQNGSIYRRMEGEISNIEQIKEGIYEVDLIPFQGFVLKRTGDKFTFPFKIYNLQRSFIDHIKRTYSSTKGNFGVLFTGTRGTGKTISAKVLANELNLPVILVKSMGDNNSDMISFLSSFNFDCIFFFDEFEKQFHENDCSILQIMDGVYNSEYRKIFLLTTNYLTINENLISRPSRIRYVRTFGNLSREVVEEILNDTLHDLTCKEELMEYVDTLTISTIDILKAIIEEVNIHGISEFLEFKKSFNVEKANYAYYTLMGSTSISFARDSNFNCETFIREVNKYKNRFAIGEEFEKRILAATSQEDVEKLQCEREDALKTRLYLSYRTVDDVDKPWNKLIPNKDEFEDSIIVKIDKENKVIVTMEEDSLYFYYIENPDAKPSLYSPPSSNLSIAL